MYYVSTYEAESSEYLAHSSQGNKYSLPHTAVNKALSEQNHTHSLT